MLSRRKVITTIAAALISATCFISSAFAQNSPQVTLETSMGNIVIALDTKNAPETSANFLRYAETGFYENTIFHRVIDGFMIQGGGFNAGMEQKQTNDPIKLEISPELKNQRGTIAMARTNNPNSATSQFFINLVDNASLDSTQPNNGYAVFGRVVQGMDIVDKIRAVPTGNNKGHQNVPLTPVVINKVSIAMPY
ncbi:MAG: peptidylprolyl isomerase [Saezia sp.]